LLEAWEEGILLVLGAPPETWTPARLNFKGDAEVMFRQIDVAWQCGTILTACKEFKVANPAPQTIPNITRK
jgi:hypothetical protein